MGRRIKLPDISALPIDERLDLVERIWDTIIADPDGVPVPDWHNDVLEQRLAAHADAPMAGATLKAVAKRLAKAAML